MNRRRICDRCIDRRLSNAGLDFTLLASCADALATEILRRQQAPAPGRLAAYDNTVHR